jgi:hypothetical protein
MQLRIESSQLNLEVLYKMTEQTIRNEGKETAKTEVYFFSGSNMEGNT